MGFRTTGLVSILAKEEKVPLSPCVDAGDPSLKDPDGSRLDMGALPLDPRHCGQPRAVCAAKVNSQGCTPSIGFVGTPSVSGPDDFVIVADGVLNQRAGLLLWSLQPGETPFHGGLLCLAGSLVRTPVQLSGGNPPPDDCSGSYAYAFTQATMAARGLVAGATVYAQYWSRDTGFPPPEDVGLTDSLRFTICP